MEEAVFGVWGSAESSRRRCLSVEIVKLPPPPVCHSMHAEVRGQCRSPFSLSIMWMLGSILDHQDCQQAPLPMEPPGQARNIFKAYYKYA